MTLDDALAADCDGRVREAAAAYESVLLSAPVDLTALVNLTVLYWQATDFGYSASRHLDVEFVAEAAKRIPELLTMAHERCTGRPEIEFWTKYIRWIDLGEPFDSEDCRQLLNRYPEYLEPAVVLFLRTGGAESEAETMRLLESCSRNPTTRCRYIASVIEGVLTRNKGRYARAPLAG